MSSPPLVPVEAPTTIVARLLEKARRPAAVVTDLDLDLPDVHPVGATLPADTYRTVVLVTADVATLRTDVSRLGNLRWARMVAVVVGDCSTVLTLRPHPSWPGVADLDARLDGAAAVTRIDFAARLEVAPVLLALARSAAAPVRTGPGGLRVAGDVVPPADPTYVGTYDVDDKTPTDVVITGETHQPALSPVLGRAPAVVTPAEAGEPLDEAVYNPIGFRRDWQRPMVDLPADTRLSPALVAGLRDAQGVSLAPDATPRLRAGLAMCAIPTEQHDDPVARERHCVQTRRAALLAHSTIGWRARLATRAGVAHELFAGEVETTATDPDEVTDLLLARHYSGADLVVLPDDPTGPTECFVAAPPDGVLLHDPRHTADEIVASGGRVYVARPRWRS